jgi:hypothetical protein
MFGYMPMENLTNPFAIAEKPMFEIGLVSRVRHWPYRSKPSTRSSAEKLCVCRKMQHSRRSKVRYDVVDGVQPPNPAI